MEKLRKLYDDILPEYRSAEKIAIAYIDSMCNDRVGLARKPIKSIANRIKTFESVIEKCERRMIPFEIGAICENFHDIAGIRIVCPFLDDVYAVQDDIRKMPNLMVTKIKDYIKTPKPNGYSSLHLILSVPICLSGGPKLVPLEIQIRTVAMDMWASIEHIVKYKSDNPDPKAAILLKQLAEIFRQLEHVFISLRDYNPQKAESLAETMIVEQLNQLCREFKTEIS